MRRSIGELLLVLSLAFGFQEGVQAQTSLTGVNRDSQLQLNIGGRGSLPPPSAPSRASQEEGDPSRPSPQVWAEWHIQMNVCSGHLSTEELAALFPIVNQALVDKVCQGGS